MWFGELKSGSISSVSKKVLNILSQKSTMNVIDISNMQKIVYKCMSIYVRWGLWYSGVINCYYFPIPCNSRRHKKINNKIASITTPSHHILSYLEWWICGRFVTSQSSFQTWHMRREVIWGAAAVDCRRIPAAFRKKLEHTDRGYYVSKQTTAYIRGSLSITTIINRR